MKGPNMLNCISNLLIFALILTEVYLGTTNLLVAPNVTPLTSVTVPKNFKKVSHQTTDFSVSPPKEKRNKIMKIIGLLGYYHHGLVTAVILGYTMYDAS